MKKNCMTGVFKKLALPVVVYGLLWMGSSAQAAGQADIKSIKTTPGLENTTLFSAGSKIEIMIGMIGNCAMTNMAPGPFTLPQIRMVVNGENAGFAQMETPPSFYSSSFRTYFTFYYTVKPGDMASPLKIFGDTGGSSSGDSYDIVNHGYVFYNQTTGSNLVWRFNTVATSVPGDVFDLDFTMVAKRSIKTLAFDDAHSPVSVAATENTTWRVTTQNPIIDSVVSFYVWPVNTNLVRVGSVPGQKALLVSMPVGSTTIDFPLTGLATGTTDIVVQRVSDYNPNATAPTNAVTRQITVTSPPEPTVKVVLAGSDSVTLDESSALNTGALTVELSQTFAQDVWVRLNTIPSVQNNLALVPSPYYVRVPAGSLASSVVPFSLPDGTVTSLLTGIVVSPTVTNSAAASFFTRMKTGTVYVRNVKPLIQQPLATDTPTATRGEPFAFDWTVSDVPADVASGMTITWNFGDGTPNVIVSNAAGSVYHTYGTPATGTGTKTVKVTAKDKDGAVSDEVQFTVTVVQPVPKPSIRVVPSSFEYSETSTNNTGVLNLVLSESFTEDVWVSLTTSPAGQSNIVFGSTNAIRISSGSISNAVGIKFSIPDGTLLSETAGIDIIPTVTNTLAQVYYTDVQPVTVYVSNVRPKVTKPLAADLSATPLTPFNSVPMGTPFAFNWTVVDVPADGSSMAVTWDFGDGITKTVTGQVGVVSHTYTSLGDKIVTVQAVDKDGGVSDEIQFKVTVVPPPPLPTVSIIPPAGPLDESATPSTGAFTVHLSETFTNTVTVQLNVTPANSAVNGTITLSTNRVLIAKGQTDVVVRFSAKDGTPLSRDTGFTVTPVVLATPEAIAHYTEIVPGLIEVLNVAPVILTPVASPTTGTDVAYTIAQGTPWTFYWDINDVALDLPTMSVTWYFGDGASQVLAGGSGSVIHTYSAIGDMVLRVVAVDKDGGRHEVQFKIRVSPSKAVNVTPVGPNMEANYWGAAGLGNGMVSSPEARSSQNRNNVYFFKYDPGVTSATLEALPYKTKPLGYYYVTNFTSSGTAVASTFQNEYDSFFYVWVGTDQGLAEQNLLPAQAGPTVVVTLPASQTTGGAGTVPSGVDIRDIQAIFSREFRIADNMGDINLDGIPDKIATRYNLPTIAGGATAGTSGTAAGTPVELVDVSGYNGDLDFLPGAASGGSAIIGGVSNVFATIGDPFTAFLEVRGFHPGLNNAQYGSDDDFGPGETRGDEPRVGDKQGTDPTKLDTDGDNFPDGWEYYFWYNATMKHLTGMKYNPQDVANGTVIPYKDIVTAFDPLVPATDTETGAAINRDMDDDGLSDIEELSIGTNPIEWDTDGDGMCDGWEVLRGLNPNDSRDGFNASMNNPDGDYMAYATVVRQLVTAVNGNTTNSYLATGAATGTNTGVFTTWYHYGNTNAPIAVGRRVALAAGEAVTAITVVSNAVILHTQVYQEFGFDPRTAWSGSVNPALYSDRFPDPVKGASPHTKPFTSVDEYLLLKFMSENRLHGAGADIGAGNAGKKTQDWSAYSTHPKTPDSDVAVNQAGDVVKTDGMPDGWELYVSCQRGTTNMVITPWSPYDGDESDDDIEPGDPKGDKLNNLREFAGTDSVAAYTNAAFYGLYNKTVTITRPTVDQYWVNKFWPTDPWNKDTDGDGMNDGAENAFMYGKAVDNGSTCVPGGGLNPCSVDTERDSLPDGWESQFSGTIPTAAPFSITNGMDGTVNDAANASTNLATAAQDWDRDGLLNYQEYWVQAVRGFRYDIPRLGVTGLITGNAGLPMDISFAPASLFTHVTNVWDNARKTWGANGPDLYILLPVGPAKKYVSTDPRDHDTDGDGMDDFYEMFHGLNPILGEVSLVKGDRVKEAYFKDGRYLIDYSFNEWWASLTQIMPMDFITYPWLAGLDWADPDADGLLNLEEQLQADMAAPSCSNTDPTPLWMTDAYNPESLTARFYWYGGMFFWPATKPVPPGYKMFSFEMNEGYDTDNDGVSDKAELMQTATTQSDPQDSDDPMRRQALWFNGTNSAAQTFGAARFGEWAFRSFTLELWAYPEAAQKEQVLIERPIVYGPSDLSTTGLVIRVNYRIGIAADGRVYAMYQNAGGHDSHTGEVKAYGPVLPTNRWAHLAARMDGAAGELQLLVNGRVEVTVQSSLIPANGVINLLTDPDTAQYPNPNLIVVGPGPVILGASSLSTSTNETSVSWESYGQLYQGYIDEVRIWDGARSNDEILRDYTKRYTRTDLLANRRAVREIEAVGGSRVVGVTPQLPPELIYHYTFDNLFSADSTASVAKAPRGFNDPQVTTNRPGGTVAGFWVTLPTRSTVYDDYGYVPWIENGVGHLPIFGGVTLNGSNVVSRDADTVVDSTYWSHYLAGVIPTAPSVHGLEKYNFPNSNNPYGFWYKTSLDVLSLSGAGERFAGDLLPRGGAYPKQALTMWDNDGASGVWAETGTDSDSDGLPDWWEDYAAAVGLGSNLNWYTLLADGMTAGERYMRDLALGYTLSNNPNSPGYNPATLVKQSADSDGDGLPDWWENLYNLKTDDSTGVNGSNGDPDRDGLSNYAEYLISERFGFRLSRPTKFRTIATQLESDYFQKQGLLYLGEMFSDHDFMEGTWEDAYDPYYVSRFVYDSQMDIDEDGWSNWSESRYGASALRSNPAMGMHLNPEGDSVKDFPVPVIETRLTYNGLRPIGNLMLFAYSKPEMDGVPDAIYRVQTVGSGLTTTSKNLGYWGAKKIKGFLSPGTVVPGSITIYFVDPADNFGYVYNVIAGHDVGDSSGITGVIKGENGLGSVSDIGTINYVTGEYQIDMGSYEGYVLSEMVSTTLVVVARPENSYVKIEYQSSQIMGWPKTLYLSDAEVPTAARLSLGYIKEGTNYFFGMIDLNNNGAWDAGEPCGVSDGFGVNIGWDRNLVDIALTDITPGFLRMTLSPATRSEDVYYGTGGAQSGSGTTVALEKRVRVRRKTVDGVSNYQTVVLDRTIQAPRAFINESDVLAQGEFGLDWGLPGVPTAMNRDTVVYDVTLGDTTVLTNAVLTFTNTFDSVRAKAGSAYPVNGAYVYSARPTFKWSMPQGYTAFTLEIRKGSSAGTLVYSSGTVMAPERDADGLSVWTAPIHAGNRIASTGQIFASNTAYAWRVIAQNSKFADAPTGAVWSDWKMFRLDVNQPLDSAGYGAIQARVTYYGPATNLLSGRVRVQAFRNAAFTGVPDSECVVSDLASLLTPGATNVNAVLRGLAPSVMAGDYYLRAYIDHNTNGVRDVWESWGYANYYGITDTPYDPYPITVKYESKSQVYDIRIEDADSDQDWYPDAWEYQLNPTGDFLNLTGPTSASDGDAHFEINPFLTPTSSVAGFTLYSLLAFGTSDFDGDGLGDMAELVLGSNASATSSSGDGFADGAKISLGLSPYDTLTFNVTGVSLSDAAATVQWNLNVKKATDLSRSLLSITAPADARYEIQYKASLADPVWTTVVTGTVTLDGAQPDKVNQVGLSALDTAQGFFRVQLKTP